MTDRGHVDPWRLAGLLAICLFCGIAWGAVVWVLGIRDTLFTIGTMALALAAFSLPWWRA